MFGTGPANMLEAKVVTAQGEVVVASEYQNEDLFYALRGGEYTALPGQTWQRERIVTGMDVIPRADGVRIATFCRCR